MSGHYRNLERSGRTRHGDDSTPHRARSPLKLLQWTTRPLRSFVLPPSGPQTPGVLP